MEKRETPQDRYHKAHTVSLTIRLMKNTEQDILQKLGSVPNKAGYIKALIRADIHKNREKVGETHKIPEDIFRNPDGRKTRNDKTIGAIRKEFEKSQKKK